MLLHSAGVVDAGSAWVFVGRSGAGKTTLAGSSLAAGREILSDDLNAVVPAPGGPRVAPVPFAGDHRGSATEPVRLAALCRLVQGRRTLLEPMSGAEALSTLLAAAPFVNQDPHRLEQPPRRSRGASLHRVHLPCDRGPGRPAVGRVREGSGGRVIPGDAVFRTRDDVRYRMVAPEAVVVRQSGPEVLVLNGVGARVLEGVAAGQPFAKLVAAIAEEYDVPALTLERDVGGFLDELTASGVIEKAPATHGK